MTESSAATLAYMRRWNIETGFEKLKPHGVHMESSRLRGDGKMELLLAALAIAMAWSCLAICSTDSPRI